MSKIKRRTFLKTGALIGLTPMVGAKILNGLTPGKPIISSVKGTDYYQNTIKAVEAVGGIKKFVPKGSTVGILANPQRNNPGAFTSPQVLSAAIQLCKNAKAKEINLISLLSMKSWESTGLLKVVNDHKVNLKIIDRKDDSLFKQIPIPGGKALKEARIMKEFFKNDVFINIPITKDHAGNKFTGTLKNMMGLNSQSSNRTFHKKGWKTEEGAIIHLDQSIADLNTVAQPDLCIVDATEFIITNGPFGPGEIFKPQRVIAGTDRVAIDSYCCTLWGLKPEDIFMIQRAYEHNLGEMNLKKIKVKEFTV